MVKWLMLLALLVGVAGGASAERAMQAAAGDDYLYCVVDLSGGTNAVSYPVTYLDAPPDGDFNVDAYKTSKLVLRRIEAGSFKMQGLYDVTLTKPFYVGLFEVTQRQWELVMGTRPSYFANTNCYASRPVEQVSYDMVRGSQEGAGWPATNAVDATSFLGKLRARTGLDLDLPTEAQWEYAGRAGTTTDYNSGKDYGHSSEDPNMAEVGRYWYNGGQNFGSDCGIDAGTARVGSYLPNAWGLYDMHGNVKEWCLDGWQSGLAAATDPTGGTSDSHRVFRGGSWNDIAEYCILSYRYQSYYEPSFETRYCGFRLAWTPSAPPRPPAPVITPADGTVISDGQSVIIACEDPAAALYYTLDGSEPTTASTEYKRFRAWGKTTVKAIAVRGDRVSDVAVAHFALGRCDDPVIVSAGGVAFDRPGNAVTISGATDAGTLRYTLDGRDPTEESPVYAGPFAIDETTTVKAKVFGDTYFDSAVVTSVLTRVREAAATPVIYAPASFQGSRTSVSITCATAGARIHYALDGGEPTAASPVYAGPFAVSTTVTVKAFARCENHDDSAVASWTIAKEGSIGDALGAPDKTFATAGDAVWFADERAGAMRSGAIGNGQTSILSTVVMGPGRLSFDWRTSCEEDPDFHEWDHAECLLDGVREALLEGVGDWTNVVLDVAGDGAHTVQWLYVKDEEAREGEDCAWVKSFVWEGAASYTATQTTPVAVPYDWIRRFFPGTPDAFDAYEAVPGWAAANGRTVSDCYVAGLDPANPRDDLRAEIAVSNGQVCVSWSPDLNEREVKRLYRVKGRASLSAGDWTWPATPAHCFFKVEVVLPTGEETDVPGPQFALPERSTPRAERVLRRPISADL